MRAARGGYEKSKEIDRAIMLLSSCQREKARTVDAVRTHARLLGVRVRVSDVNRTEEGGMFPTPKNSELCRISGPHMPPPLHIRGRFKLFLHETSKSIYEIQRTS